MITISKKFVVDDRGNPKEVIIPIEDYKKIEEILGLDLDETAIRELSEARSDRKAGNTDAYENVESI